MVDTEVEVTCDAQLGEDYCEAMFRVSRSGLNWDLRRVVERQLARRGWERAPHGRVLCPLHKDR